MTYLHSGSPLELRRHRVVWVVWQLAQIEVAWTGMLRLGRRVVVFTAFSFLIASLASRQGTLFRRT